MKSSTIQSNWYHILNFAILIALIAGPIAAGHISLWWTIFILIGHLRHSLISTNGGVDRHPLSNNMSGMALMTYNVIAHTLFWPISVLATLLRKFKTRLDDRADFAQ